LGGAAGTAARYGVGDLVVRWWGTEFPYGTFIVTVTGSFLIGLIQQVALSTLAVPETARLVLTIGVMGGFTTYSSFSYETIRLIEEGSWLQAGANVVLTTGACLGVCTLGLALGRVLVGGRAMHIVREVRMIDRRPLALAGALLAAGCATNMTPAQKMAHEIFVQVASHCESRYHTIHVDQIDLEGGLKIHADADSRTEYRAFVTCYVEGLKARAEERRKAGQPELEGLTHAPDVELD
jgi:fluoride exporter